MSLLLQYDNCDDEILDSNGGLFDFVGGFFLLGVHNDDDDEDDNGTPADTRVNLAVPSFFKNTAFSAAAATATAARTSC